MEENEIEFMQSLEVEAKELRAKNTNLNTALASSSYQNQGQNNLIEFQLETADLLTRLEHFLKGEYISTDDQGNEFWLKQEDKSLILLNDYGVNCIMAIIGGYVDKSTVLSTYDEMRINEILADLGDELANWVFCNYEKIGMDTEFKKTRFQLLVLNILHTIETAYRRALRGQTREDLNSSKIFTQSDMIGNRIPIMKPQKKSFNPFKPNTW